jgi:hypothetical protein
VTTKIQKEFGNFFSGNQVNKILRVYGVSRGYGTQLAGKDPKPKSHFETPKISF